MVTREGGGDPWTDCAGHVWVELESMFCNEFFTDVRCEKCRCPGQLNCRDGSVFWPAT
jgi:hypothetical protein